MYQLCIVLEKLRRNKRFLVTKTDLRIFKFKYSEKQRDRKHILRLSNSLVQMANNRPGENDVDRKSELSDLFLINTLLQVQSTTQLIQSGSDTTGRKIYRSIICKTVYFSLVSCARHIKVLIIFKRAFNGVREE